MFYSFRSKLFVISVGLLAVFMFGIGIYLHETIRGWTESRLEYDLQARAELVVEGLEAADGGVGTEQFIDGLESSNHHRVTIIEPDGRVAADTHLEGDKLAEADNHAGRPEVEAAIEEGSGVATRHSDSVDFEMLYVAVPAADDRVVRVALPMEEVDEALARLRLILGVGGLLGIGVAIFMSSVASRLASQVFRRVLDRARREPAPRRTTEGAGPEPDDSTGGQARPPSRIAERLEETMDLLVSERNRFRTVLDGMNEGVVATDADLEITLCNRAVHRLIESDSALEGTRLDEVLDEEVVAPLVDEETDSVEFETDQAPTRQIHVRATPRPESAGWIFVLHDVTTIRQLETMRRDFVANVSHELKTPVTVIRANAQTLLEGALDDPDHARSFTEGIERNADRLSNLIADLLDLSEIESGEIDLEIEALAVGEVVDRVVDDVRDRGGDQGPGVRCSVGDELVVRADAEALRRVVTNLVENALKYGDEPVEIRARSGNEHVVVEVRDDGPGVGVEDRDRIFERFYRVDDGRASARGGTGLGLSIVKHLVDQMEGEVGYRREDATSIFWFRLPGEGQSGQGS